MNFKISFKNTTFDFSSHPSYVLEKYLFKIFTKDFINKSSLFTVDWSVLFHISISLTLVKSEPPNIANYSNQ